MSSKWKGKKILILGSGGLRIGQAGEFDYSGSQAIKALKEEGIETILVNPNIATVQTDPGMSDKLYLEPLNVDSVSKIIEKERPDGLLLGFGGQTALNLGLQLEKAGILEKFEVTVLGTSVDSIRRAEDRGDFKDALTPAKIKTAKSFAVTSVSEALEAAKELSYPVMLRSAFSLGGLGSGVVHSEKELKEKALEALAGAEQILVEEYLKGWKEVEYEVIRDSKGQALVICNMENFDPMGVHTGESIVIAPSQTLNDEEYQKLRSVSIQVANLFEVTGECNVQFALNPENADYRVIEMNPRLSRSSALASKATGYPIAFVAAKLALGYTLDQVKNSITQKTTAFFEPSLDYVAVKIPRWDIQKMRLAKRSIGTEMKSVGEVMALGRSFPEALQKGIRMLNIGSTGLNDAPELLEDLESHLTLPTDCRLFALYRFFMEGATVKEAEELTRINPWFLCHLADIAHFERELKNSETLNASSLLEAKKKGFSDEQIARFFHKEASEIRELRLKWNITPCVKQIDTFAGEFPAFTNYLYMTYHGQEHDLSPSENKAAVVIGSGPYCIGSSVEFDWCAVNTSRTLRKNGVESIIINSNPETVSTDYDESDRLYFEEITEERVLDICDFENPYGVVVSVGGQASNNLALPLYEKGVPILGTSPISIDMAENRKTFSSLLNKLHINQPEWISVSNPEEAKEFANDVGYPVLIRPSYVLSGAAMHVAYSENDLSRYLLAAARVSKKYPVVLSKFILDAKELDIDGVAQNGEVCIEAVSEHIENAGVHSGDATVVLPPQKLYVETIRKAKKATREIVKALKISGPFNIQFIACDNEIRVIECNVRASRSFPFVSKVTGYNFIEIAAEIFLGKYKKKHYETLDLDYFGVKVPQFSYSRLKGADPVTDVEMNSTGEVACLGRDFHDAFFRSWKATEQSVAGKRILMSISSFHKEKLFPLIKKLELLGWEVYATEGTHGFLTNRGVGAYFVYKVSDSMTPNVEKLIEEQEVDLIINIPSGRKRARSDGYRIRRLAIDHHIPLITNLQIAEVFLRCLTIQGETPKAHAYEEYQPKLFHFSENQKQELVDEKSLLPA